MPPNYRAPHIRQYREEHGDFRTLSIVTKAIASYIRVLVDPEHGWLPLGGKTVARAIRLHATGKPHKNDHRILERCVAALLTEGYLVRCTVNTDNQAVFPTVDGRELPLSDWREQPEGDWVVIKNWVPAQHCLTPAQTRAWHQARRNHGQHAERSS